MVRIVKGAYHVLSQVSHLEHDRGNATTKITPPARASCYRCPLPSVESELPVVTVGPVSAQVPSVEERTRGVSVFLGLRGRPSPGADRHSALLSAALQL